MTGNMRLQTLELKDFRCFRQEVLDLSGDVTLIYARNGVGKTAIFDAIELALLGEVGRFAADSPGLKIFANQSGDGGFHVSLNLAVDGQDPQIISASWEESQDRLQLRTSGGWSEHRDLLYNFLINSDALRPARRQRNLAADLFRSSLLLSQDLMRWFIEGTPSDRRLVVSQLAGTALLSSCLKKATAVQAEARRRQNALATEMAEAKQAVASASAELHAYARLSVELSNLVDADVVIGALKAALENIGLSRKVLEGLLELAPADIVDRIDARIEATSSDLEVALATAREALESLRRAADLDKRIAEGEKRLRQLEEEAEKHSKSVKDEVQVGELLLKRVNDASATVAAAERDLAQTRRISVLESELRRARAAAKDAGERASPIERRLAELEAAHEALEGRRSLLLDERAVLTESLTKDEATLEEMGRIQHDYARRSHLSKEVEQLANARVEIDESINALGARLSTSRQELAKAVEEEERQSKLLEAEQAKSQRWESLAAQLADLVADHNCPLCGTEFGSVELLREAIDAQVASIPETLRALSAQVHSSTAARSKRAAEVRALESALEPQVAAATEKDALIRELEAELSSIEARLVDQPGPAALATAMEARRKELDALKNRHEELSGEIAQLASERKAQREQRQVEQERVAEVRGEVTAAQNHVKDLSSELEALRGDGEDEAEGDASTPDEQAAIKRLERAYGEVKGAQRTLTEHSAAVKRIEEARDTAREAAEDEAGSLRLLRTERAGLQDLFDRAGLQATPTKEAIEEVIQGHGQKIKALADARRAILAYIRDKKLVAAHAEGAKLRGALEVSQAILSDKKEYGDALTAALESVADWSQALEREIQAVVAERVTRHRDPIWRLFVGMIPDPYRFGGLEIEEVDGGVVVGIKYRGQAAAAGEPKHYLSHAQANVLALAVFFAFGLAQQWSHLTSLLLDDPVQHLDDLDSVAFIDTVRWCVSSGGKQVVMSTCDRDLYILMLRKLGLLEYEGVKVTGITLRDGGTDGPQVNYDFGGPSGRRVFAVAV